MPKRVIMVQFRADASTAEIKQFEAKIGELAESVEYKTSIHRGENIALSGEADLDKVAPDVTVPSYMVVWDFPTQAELERFSHDQNHKNFAGGFARSIVEHRFVMNIA